MRALLWPLRRHSGSFLRYGVVGGLGTLLHLGLLALAVERWAWSPLAATSLGFCAALAVSYGLNRRWTFESQRAHAQGAWRYAAVSVLGLGVNAGLMTLLVQWLGFWYFGAQLAVIFVVPLLNYVLNRYWTFSEP